MPSRRGPGKRLADGGVVSKHVAMGWARRLKRVFGIEIGRCVRSGGATKVIAGIEDVQVIAAILEHMRFNEHAVGSPRSASARANHPR